MISSGALRSSLLSGTQSSSTAGADSKLLYLLPPSAWRHFHTHSPHLDSGSYIYAVAYGRARCPSRFTPGGGRLLREYGTLRFWPEIPLFSLFEATYSDHSKSLRRLTILKCHCIPETVECSKESVPFLAHLLQPLSILSFQTTLVPSHRHRIIVATTHSHTMIYVILL